MTIATVASSTVFAADEPAKTQEQMKPYTQKIANTEVTFDMVPIPGTTRRKHLEENVGALAVSLSAADLSSIDEAAPKGVAAGDRYTAEGMRAVNL